MTAAPGQLREAAPRAGRDGLEAAPPRPVFVGSEIYRRAAYGSNHPLTIPRVGPVMDLCRILGWLDDGAWRAAADAYRSLSCGAPGAAYRAYRAAYRAERREQLAIVRRALRGEDPR